MTDFPPDFSNDDSDPNDEDEPATTLDPARASLPLDATTLDPNRIAPAPSGPDDPIEPATTLDPHRDQASGETWTGRLPPDLAERFDLVQVLPTGGEASQATLFKVQGKDDQKVRLLRLYHDGRHPEATLWASLKKAQRNSSRLLRFEETGQANGLSYELAEFIAGDTLARAIQGARSGWPPARVAEFVQQMTEALAALHAEGVVHRDVKPANIMVRRLSPLDLVLIDFGISRITATPMEFATKSMTVQYAAPERASGDVSTPNDWWSLGISAAELATGRHPFAGLSDAVILKQLATRPVDVSRVTDERLHLLCRGLLVRDPAERWSAPQVEEWIGDGTPPLFDDSTYIDGPTPLRLNGRAFVSPEALAANLTERWFQSVAQLTGPDSPALASIGEWLAQFHHSPEDTAGWADLLQYLRATDELADVRLLRLVRHLGPTLPPTYRSTPMTSGDLVGLASSVTFVEEHTAADTERNIADLWKFRLLPAMAGGPAGADLVDVDQRWLALNDEWTSLLDRMRASNPAVHARLRDVASANLPARLLYLAAGGPRVEEQLRRRVTERHETFAGIPWFGMLAGLPPGPSGLRVGLLAAALLIPAAEATAQRAQRLAETQRRQDEAALRYDAIDEWYRREDRYVALGWAAAGVVIVVAFWIILITISDVLPYSSPEYIADAWATAFVSILVVFGGEVTLAAAVGGPYAVRSRPASDEDEDDPEAIVDVDERPGLLTRAGYSLVGLLTAAAGGIGRAALGAAHRRHRYGGLIFLGSIAVALILGVVLTLRLPVVLPLTATVAYAGWTVYRARRWRRERAERDAMLARARERRFAGTPIDSVDSEVGRS